MSELRAKWSILGTTLHLDAPGIGNEVARMQIPDTSMAEVALGAMRWVYHNGTPEERAQLVQACAELAPAAERKEVV